MDLQTLGDVIAVRTLQFAGTGEVVTIQLGKPHPFPDGSGFYCPYQIFGTGSERVKYAAGVDAVQALQLVMRMVAADLHALNIQSENRLVWTQGEGSNPGFPDC